MEYILTGKFFIIEIDNKNSTYLNTESSFIVTRWRHFIQGFHNCIRYIQGKFNTSDWLTRQYNLFNLYLDSDINSFNASNPFDGRNKPIDSYCELTYVLTLYIRSFANTVLSPPRLSLRASRQLIIK